MNHDRQLADECQRTQQSPKLKQCKNAASVQSDGCRTRGLHQIGGGGNQSRGPITKQPKANALRKIAAAPRWDAETSDCKSLRQVRKTIPQAVRNHRQRESMKSSNSEQAKCSTGPERQWRGGL